MRKEKTHRGTSLRFSLQENLDGKKKIFIDMAGNAQSVVLTQDSALNFALWLRDAADQIDGVEGWADEVENG